MSAVSTSAHIDLRSLLGHPASLEVSLTDGTRASFAGEVSDASLLGSEGGLARYRVRIKYWIWPPMCATSAYGESAALARRSSARALKTHGLATWMVYQDSEA